MTNEDFAARVIAMQGTLYRVTCALLRDHADREDAVQSAIEKAWRKRSSLREEARLQQWIVRILINEWNVICQGQIYPILKFLSRFYQNSKRDSRVLSLLLYRV
ncbi:MAG: hypothetical protein IKL25_00310 [Clostridia bacterium]|nr:hypothetical protein [Clostridia bacterium]